MKKCIAVVLILCIFLSACNGPRGDSPTSNDLRITTEAFKLTLTEDFSITPNAVITVIPSETLSPTRKIQQTTRTPTKDPTATPKTTLSELPITTELCTNLRKADQNNTGGDEEIFLWDYGAGLYQSYNPFLGFSSMRSLEPFLPDVTGPQLSFSFSFSQYSSKISYLVENKNNLTELWIADVNLCQAERAWIDVDRWLGTPPISLIWGPGDNSVIMTKHTNGEAKVVVYSLPTSNAYQWNGHCNQIYHSKVSDHWLLGCFIDSGYEKQFSILSPDGSISIATQQPSGFVTNVIEWAISPDGTRVLYATEDYQLMVGDEHGESSKLPIAWNEEIISRIHMITPKRGLKWAHDGEHAIVFGYDPSNNRCPETPHPETGDINELPCWMMVNVTTSEIVWWLHKEAFRQLDIPWQPDIGLSLSTYFDAELSPDDKRIAMFLLYLPIRYYIIASIETDQVNMVANYVADNIYWTKP